METKAELSYWDHKLKKRMPGHEPESNKKYVEVTYYRNGKRIHYHRAKDSYFPKIKR